MHLYGKAGDAAYSSAVGWLSLLPYVMGKTLQTRYVIHYMMVLSHLRHTP
jgi:hypothetical protein